MKPYYNKGNIVLYRGDCREVLKTLRGVDTVITDPPYGLSFMGRDWDHSVPGERFWRIIRNSCKPGATLLSFGGTRTWHRLACAIEDGGWELWDHLMWLFSTGFPKSTDIAKQIDRAAGKKGKVISRKKQKGAKFKTTQKLIDNGGFNDPEREEFDVTELVTDEAKEWQGFGTGLKPAYEGIICARKEVYETYAKNAKIFGVSGLNIDAARIQTKAKSFKDEREDKVQKNAYGKYEKGVDYDGSKGRWPSNVILSHSSECVFRGTQKIKGHKGYPKGSGGGKGRMAGMCDGNKENADKFRAEPIKGFADEDGNEVIEVWDCHEHCVVRMLNEQGKHTKSSSGVISGRGPKTKNIYGKFKGNSSGLGKGDSGGPCRFFYVAKASTRERGYGNDHPTVKPVKLLEYLCRLTKTPTGGIVLDPFMGSGSTGVACVRTGRKFIGIELEEKYCELAAMRIEKAQYAAKNRRKVRKIMKSPIDEIL